MVSWETWSSQTGSPKTSFLGEDLLREDLYSSHILWTSIFALAPLNLWSVPLQYHCPLCPFFQPCQTFTILFPQLPTIIWTLSDSRIGKATTWVWKREKENWRNTEYFVHFKGYWKHPDKWLAFTKSLT